MCELHAFPVLPSPSIPLLAALCIGVPSVRVALQDELRMLRMLHAGGACGTAAERSQLQSAVCGGQQQQALLRVHQAWYFAELLELRVEVCMQEAQAAHLPKDLSDGLLCAVINNNTRCYNESTEFADHLDDALAPAYKVRPLRSGLCFAHRVILLLQSSCHGLGHTQCLELRGEELQSPDSAAASLPLKSRPAGCGGSLSALCQTCVLCRGA